MVDHHSLFSFFCDSITNQFVQEAICLPVVALHSFDELEQNCALNTDLIAIIIDASATNHENSARLVERSKQLWPYAVRLAFLKPGDEEGLDKLYAAGVSDVCFKPLRQREILARMQARLSDYAELKKLRDLRFADVVLDPLQKKISVKGRHLVLTPLSFSVMTQLMITPETVITRKAIMSQAWPDSKVCEGALDKQIHDLRTSLKELGSRVEIKSVYGEGYILRSSDKALKEKPKT